MTKIYPRKTHWIGPSMELSSHTYYSKCLGLVYAHLFYSNRKLVEYRLK